MNIHLLSTTLFNNIRVNELCNYKTSHSKNADPKNKVNL